MKKIMILAVTATMMAACGGTQHGDATKADSVHVDSVHVDSTTAK